MTSPPHKHLLLIGGGHAHALVLKHWQQRPLDKVRLTLVSPQPLTPYSGMLPGLVAGHYRFDDTHINLPALCTRAGVAFVEAAATAIDLQQQRVQLDRGETLSYDLLSINSGITPDLSVDGAATHTLPVKPIARFYPQWLALKEKLAQTQAEQRIGVVGGGAAGVELILAMHQALASTPGAAKLRFHLAQRNSGLPEGYPARLQKKMAGLVADKGIQVSEGFEVTRVEPGSSDSSGKRLIAADGRRLELDHIFWCTQAQAADWPAASGLATDEQGFILCNAHLQSVRDRYCLKICSGRCREKRSNPIHPSNAF